MFRQSLFAVSGAILLTAVPAYCQLAISAKSGMVHYAEGDVKLADKPLVQKKGEFPQLIEGQILQTAAGRAEVLLTPGVFLRIAEQSEVRLDSGRLSDTRLELLAGSVLVEVGEMEKDNSIRIVASGTTLDFRKKGLFRINADPGSLRVYDGEVTAVRGSQTLTVKEGRETLLNGVLASEKFNKEDNDGFYRWAGRRASYLSAANLASAKSVLDSGSTWSRGGWYFNDNFGLYTYLPGAHNYFSPFGYNYYSPGRVGSIFYGGYMNSGGGYYGGIEASSAGFGGGGSRSAMSDGNSGMRSSGGYSAGGYSGGSAPAAAAPAAPSGGGRSAGGGGSHESRGGR